MFRKDPREREEQARKARQAAERYLAPTKVKLLGSFTRVMSDADGDLVWLFFTGPRWLVRTAQGRWAHRLPTNLLLAVTGDDKVHFLKYRTRHKEVEIRQDFLVLDRDAVRFKVAGEDVRLNVSEGEYTTSIDIDHKSLEEPGAAEVVAALAKQHANEAAGLRE